MELHAIRNRKGFTLVEVLVAMVIMAIILLGNMAALSLSYRRNLQNILRDEAVKVAQEEMERYRDSGACDAVVTRTRQIRNYQWTFTVNCGENSLSGGITQVTIRVSWQYPEGQNHSFSIVSYVQ